MGDVAGGTDEPLGDPFVGLAGGVELLEEHKRPKPNSPQLDDEGEVGGGDVVEGDVLCE